MQEDQGKRLVSGWVEIHIANEAEETAKAEGISIVELMRRALTLYSQVVKKMGPKSESKLMLSGRRIGGGPLEVAVDASVKKGG